MFSKVDEYIAAVIIGNVIFASIKGLHKRRKCQVHLIFSRHILLMLHEVHDLYKYKRKSRTGSDIYL